MGLPKAILVEELTRDEIIRSLSLGAAAQILSGAGTVKDKQGNPLSMNALNVATRDLADKLADYVKGSG